MTGSVSWPRVGALLLLLAVVAPMSALFGFRGFAFVVFVRLMVALAE